MSDSKQLVPIQEQEIGETFQKSVSARELHVFLESKQDFSNWILNRIKKYRFIENEDFSINLLKSQRGRPKKEYILTLDMAKELSMVENNEKGRQARRYFIQCEKALRQIVNQDKTPKPKRINRANHYTVQAYGKYHNILVTLDEMAILQKECIRLSKLNKMPYFPFNDRPSASIFTFHNDVLELIFSEIESILESRQVFDFEKSLLAEKKFLIRANQVGNGVIGIIDMIEENKKMHRFIIDKEMYQDYQLYKRLY